MHANSIRVGLISFLCSFTQCVIVGKIKHLSVIVRKGGFIQLINHAVERKVKSLRITLKLLLETIILSHSYMFIGHDIWYILLQVMPQLTATRTFAILFERHKGGIKG